MKKRNEYLMKQVRLFILARDGTMKYYKNKTLQRGTIILDSESRLNKTSKNSFEIVTPSRTWYLYEVEANTTDAWIRDIQAVINTLWQPQDK